jgi:hypothetical protein
MSNPVELKVGVVCHLARPKKATPSYGANGKDE